MVPGLITVSSAAVRRGNRLVLDHIDFSISPGEIVTVVGPNGSGKSTFISLLIGSLKASRGSVDRKPGLKIGYVPQRLQVTSTLPITLQGFLSLGAKRGAHICYQILSRVGLEGTAQRQMTELSGGELQRALLARALVDTPELLILDEPTQGLDQLGTAAFYHLIEQLRQETGCAVLMVSHDLHVVMSASDRVICINGHICCEGAPQVVSEAPEYRAMFGTGTKGALALYQHHHDHAHGRHHDHDHKGKSAQVDR